MGFKTPRGRQIDWSAEPCFALMAQIWEGAPRFTAYHILRVCEAIDNIPEIAALLSAVGVVIFLPDPTWEIVAAHVIGAAAGTLMLAPAIGVVFIIPGLVPFARVWNSIPEILRLLVPPLVIALTLGWLAGLLWIGGLLAGSVSCMIVVVVIGRSINKRTGRVTAWGRAELSFAQAIAYCAALAGVTVELKADSVSDMSQLDMDRALRCIDHYVGVVGPTHVRLTGGDASDR